MKKDKWWGYLILLPMIVITAASYSTYFSRFLFSRPRFLLITLFCACGMILYPVVIFKNKKIRTVGAVLGVLVTMVLTVVWLLDPPVYSTDVFSNNEEHPFDESYTMFLADAEYGDVSVRYEEVIEDYLLHADFRRSGDTVLTIISPTGEKTEYDLHIEWDTFEIKKK